MRSSKCTTNCKCGTCRCRSWRKANPEKYAYNNIKNRAKQRGKPFTISFEYFLKFCYRYDYISRKGRTSKSLTADRKIEELGYIEGNLQAKPLRQNIKKYYDWCSKRAVSDHVNESLLRSTQSLQTA